MWAPEIETFGPFAQYRKQTGTKNVKAFRNASRDEGRHDGRNEGRDDRGQDPSDAD